MKNKTFPHQAQTATPHLLETAIHRLVTARRRDRAFRFLNTGVLTIAAATAGYAAAHLFAPSYSVAISGGAAAAAAICSSFFAWSSAPDLLQLARTADHLLEQNNAIETAIEGQLKGAPVTALTPILHQQVQTAMTEMPLAKLVPWRFVAPLSAAFVAIGLAIGSSYVPTRPIAAPNDTPTHMELSQLRDTLATIAALRDSDDPVLVALGVEADALAARIAANPDMTRAEIESAIMALQDKAARILGLSPDPPISDDTLARLAAMLLERDSQSTETELPDETTPITPTGDPNTTAQEQTIDAPQNDLVTMPTQSVEDAILSDDLSCVFGDEPTCEVKADGTPPPAPKSVQEDEGPEQIGRDELTEGGDPADVSETSTGDAGATGTATAALYGTAELTEAGDAAFGVETLTLGADNAMGEGRRNQIDIPTTFEGVSATHFPDAPRIGQDKWQREAEAPVLRAPADTALDRAMTEYYLAPEDWR